ncbi:MAG: adenylate/guanylate cyclase domain-containing protein [Hyphomicrobiales bacterium]|nr:adenylate/guanylate cyclase domain-containing protein [Hyphomicrobiales bacterium]
MAEKRKLAAILVVDVVGYSRLAGADEERTLARLRALRSDLIDPTISVHHGRVVKRTGDGALVEFRSVVDAVRFAIEVQSSMVERNAGLAPERCIEFRIGIHLGDVVEESDGDLMGDGVNIAARLEGIATPGSVCLSEDAYRQVRARLDLAVSDLGQTQLKNIAEPIRVYSLAIANETRPKTPAPEVAPAAPHFALPDKLSIAVLPFENLSGDPSQAYFSDGITEDIITELSRFRSLFVVARNSSFALRSTVDVTEVRRRLGVRYVVQGSVRKSGKRVRVTVELVDTATGSHLWGERYDRELEEIFVVQDEISRAVVATLPGRLEEAGRDLAKRKHTSNITAYDLVLLGNDRWRRVTGNDLAEALRYFGRAVTLDPHYARAHANVAWTHVCSVFIETAGLASLDDALRHITTALDLDDGDAWSHGVFGQLLFLLRRDDEAEIHFQRALALNPNDADVAAVFANILVYWGRWQEALTWIGTAKRLNPLPPNLYHWYHALALYSGRQYEQAIKALREMRSPDRWSHGLLAACYAQTGLLAEARSELGAFISERERELKERGEALPPGRLHLALSRADRYRNPLDREHFLDGLRKAGLTE